MVCLGMHSEIKRNNKHQHYCTVLHCTGWHWHHPQSSSSSSLDVIVCKPAFGSKARAEPYLRA